jgi:bacterial/archaeal transporter family protein
MKPWVAPTICSLGAFGFWGLFTKISSEQLNSKSSFIYQALGVGITALFSMLFLQGKVQASPHGAFCGILIGIFYSFGCIFYFVAASRGEVSTVVTVTALYPLVTVLLSVVFLNEKLHLNQVLGIGLALIAMVLLSK